MRKFSIKKCSICGVEFKTRTTRRTCSRECQNKLPGFSLQCSVCGKDFQHSNPRVKGCSAECKKKHSHIQQEKCHNKNINERRKLIRNAVRKMRKGFTKSRKKEEVKKHREWCRENPEKVKAMKISDRKLHPESHRIRSKRGKALRRKAGKFPEKEIIEKRLNHFGGCCYCDRIETLTLEHLEPISKGGNHREGNLYGACKSCNSSKQDQNWIKWYRKQKFYKPEREIEIRRMSLTVIKCKGVKQ